MVTGPDPRDLDLVRRANAGEATAFGLLYERHRQWVADLAWRVTRDHDLAIDVTQEVFLHLLARFPGFELRSAMRTYLYPVVRHTAIACQQRQRRRPEPDPVVRPRREVGAADVEALESAVDRLPTGQRDVLLLRVVDELSTGEIATALGIPPGTVKSRLHLALRSLRETLGDSFELE